MPISLVLAILTSPAAFAASYDFVYGPSPRGGFGHTAGTLNFTGARDFYYDTYIEDLCPADGYGVSFYFNFRLVNGNSTISDVKGWDTNGCGNGFAYWVNTGHRANPIKEIRLISCWTDDGNLCWSIHPNALSGWKDNPHT